MTKYHGAAWWCARRGRYRQHGASRARRARGGCKPAARPRRAPSRGRGQRRVRRRAAPHPPGPGRRRVDQVRSDVLGEGAVGAGNILQSVVAEFVDVDARPVDRVAGPLRERGHAHGLAAGVAVAQGMYRGELAPTISQPLGERVGVEAGQVVLALGLPEQRAEVGPDEVGPAGRDSVHVAWTSASPIRPATPGRRSPKMLTWMTRRYSRSRRSSAAKV
jgi:hypothetical protein